MGHILDRTDLGNNTLVTVTTRHLVTWLDATLDGQIDLDDLQYARRQVIALDDLATLVLEFRSNSSFSSTCCSAICSSSICGFIFDGQLKPLGTIQLVQTIFAVTGMNQQQVAGTAENAVFQDLELFGQVLLRFSCISSISLRACLSTPSRVKTCTSTTVPYTPFGTRRKSPSRRTPSHRRWRAAASSGVSWVSPFGVTLPTRMSPPFTSAPT